MPVSIKNRNQNPIAFRDPNKKIRLFRSSLVVSYKSSAKHKDYIEFRIWAYSRRKNKYPRKKMAYWLAKLIDLHSESNVISGFKGLKTPRPKTVRRVTENLLDRSTFDAEKFLKGLKMEMYPVYYEKDEKISKDELAPPEAKQDFVRRGETENIYGSVIYGDTYYIYQLTPAGNWKKIKKGHNLSEVQSLIKKAPPSEEVPLDKFI